MAISLPHQCRMCRRHRQQAGSHSDLRRTQILRPPPIPVGARLAPDGNLPATSISNVQTPSPAGWPPLWSAPNINTASTTIPLWERACPRWQSPCHINVECADAIASRLAPTVVCAVHKCCVHHHYPVGAGLARDGNLPATSIANPQTPSRASALPPAPGKSGGQVLRQQRQQLFARRFDLQV